MISSAKQLLFNDHAINRLSGLILVEEKITSDVDKSTVLPLLEKVDEAWCRECWSLTQGKSCKMDIRYRCYHMRAKHRIVVVDDEGNVVP